MNSLAIVLMLAMQLAVTGSGYVIDAGPPTMSSVGHPELMDVPAIQDDHIVRCFMDAQHGEIPPGCSKHVNHWSCADKSRVLLTAEDGTKHCVKF